MPKVLTNGKIKIGAYKFPDRKKPCICVEREGENVVYCYGQFNNDERADEFMYLLAELVGARKG